MTAKKENKMISVLVSYASGTEKMLDVCLKSIARHKAGEPFEVIVLTGDDLAYKEAKKVSGNKAEVRMYDTTGAGSSSGRHARMLDSAVKELKTEYFLTLDSDCFPVADEWLSCLMKMLKTPNVEVTGICWPWIPPPATTERNTIEWRVRRQHCWNNTQVACQLMRTEYYLAKGLMFADPEGDDTNFGLMDKVHADGASVIGFLPTRCALPDDGIDSSVDPECNRYVCVIYGDLIYHHGGASRETKGEFSVQRGLYDKARERVIAEEGAEWILLPENSYCYKMDNEEVVAQEKMRMFYQQIPAFLMTHNSLFGGGWV